MIEPSDVARLRELEARATPGPWLVGLEDWWGVTGWVVGREAKEPGMVGTVVATSGAGHAPDARYIAACSPEVIAALVSVAQAAEAVAGAYSTDPDSPGVYDPLTPMKAALATLKEVMSR